LLRIIDLDPRRIAGDILEREWRVTIGPLGGKRVEPNPPRPADHADVEVERCAGLRPVKRTAIDDMNALRPKANHRNASTNQCEISSSHFTSRSHRDGLSRWPSKRAGYGNSGVDSAASMMAHLVRLEPTDDVVLPDETD
jgi:hypothetical protein